MSLHIIPILRRQGKESYETIRANATRNRSATYYSSIEIPKAFRESAIQGHRQVALTFRCSCTGADSTFLYYYTSLPCVNPLSAEKWHISKCQLKFGGDFSDNFMSGELGSSVCKVFPIDRITFDCRFPFVCEVSSLDIIFCTQALSLQYYSIHTIYWMEMIHRLIQKTQISHFKSIISMS